MTIFFIQLYFFVFLIICLFSTSPSEQSPEEKTLLVHSPEHSSVSIIPRDLPLKLTVLYLCVFCKKNSCCFCHPDVQDRKRRKYFYFLFIITIIVVTLLVLIKIFE